MAGILCVLYLSISTIFAGLHHHPADALDHGQDCAACAWHTESVSDVPQVRFSVERPEAVLFVASGEHFVAASADIRRAPSRGPPSFSL